MSDGVFLRRILYLVRGYLPSGPFQASPLAPALGFRRRNWRRENLRPVELELGILLLDRNSDGIVERLAPHSDVRRRSEPIENTRPSRAALNSIWTIGVPIRRAGSASITRLGTTRRTSISLRPRSA